MNNECREISVALNAAKLYIEKLDGLKAEIQSAEMQIFDTFEETERNIEKIFSSLKDSVYKALDKKEKQLHEKAVEVKNSGLVPLNQCAAVINKNMEIAQSLISQAPDIKKSDIDKISEFLDRANLVGSLPEAPEWKDVPYISLYYDPLYENDFKRWCSNFGKIYKIPTVQIESITPRPGAILIKWQQSFGIKAGKKNVQKVRLEYVRGNIFEDNCLAAEFSECYRGPDSQYIFGCTLCLPYSFRICCKFNGSSEWSQWSIPQVGSTTIEGFSWRVTNGAILENHHKSVIVLKPNVIVFSESPSKSPPVSIDDTVTFIFLGHSFDGFVGLTTTREENLTKLVGPETFLLNDSRKSNGRTIYINGLKKNTNLPNLVDGQKVCFSLEKITDDIVRVTVDCRYNYLVSGDVGDSGDKVAVYDWSVGDRCHFYFACQMMSGSIMVQ